VANFFKLIFYAVSEKAYIKKNMQRRKESVPLERNKIDLADFSVSFHMERIQSSNSERSDLRCEA
jgi:hypothetical protein